MLLPAIVVPQADRSIAAGGPLESDAGGPGGRAFVALRPESSPRDRERVSGSGAEAGVVAAGHPRPCLIAGAGDADDPQSDLAVVHEVPCCQHMTVEGSRLIPRLASR